MKSAGLSGPVALVCLFWLLLVSAVVAAQEQSSQHEALRELELQLNLGIVEVRMLNDSLSKVPDKDREAVMFRRDERRFELLNDLDELARGAAKLPEDDPLRIEITQRLENEFADVPQDLFDRMSDFGDRIARFRAELESLDGVDKLVLEPYINSLEKLRLDSYAAAVKVIDGRHALGLPTGKIRNTLVRQLYLHAETLVGRLQFTRIASRELNQRLASDPDNADIDAALKLFNVARDEDIERLTTINDLLGKLGENTRALKSALIQQGVALSVRDLDTDIIGSLVVDSLQWLRECAVENGPDIAFDLAVFVAILLLFRLLGKLTSRAVTAACERPGAKVSMLLKETLATVTGGTVMILGLLIALAQIGISLGPMLAGLGVAGFIVGFALQDTLANFAAGGMILIYRPYDVDDFIEVAGAAGLVKKMSLVSTTITTFDNQTLVVPNSKIWGDVIKNVTAQKVRRVDLEFGISYSDDIPRTEEVLRDVVEAHELVLRKPEAMIKVHSLGDSSVNFIVRPWVKTDDYWTVYWDLTRAVKMRFDEEGISIPFPQRDVHVYREEGGSS